MRRSHVADPERRRLPLRHRQRRAGDRRARQGHRDPGVLGDLSAPRHATGRCSWQLLQVHLPLSPLELRARRPAPRCPGHGTHDRVRQEGLPAPGAPHRAVAGLRVRQLRSRRRAARPDAGPVRAVPHQLRPRQHGVPRHVHAHRSSVELEGHVRELQRRLPRQPAAPHDPGLLPERHGRVPGAVGRRRPT